MNFYKKYGYLIFLAFLILSLFDMRFAIIAIICMVAPLILALFGKGRYWCGNFCPRGNFYDNIVTKISPNRKVPKFFKSIYLRIFMIIFIFANFTIGLIKNWGNLPGIGMVFYRIIVITSIVGIVLALFFNSRTWCNFCPMGTLASFITKIRGKKTVLEVTSSCVSCNLCNKVCPMDIKISNDKNSYIQDSDCIYCLNCAYKCPKHSILKIKNK